MSIKLNLWPHQVEALKSIHTYLNKKRTEKGHLIKMPTGTGKTGVFAVLSRIELPKKNFLVVVPSTALKYQIIREVDFNFWAKMSVDHKILESKLIRDILPGNVATNIVDFKTNKFIAVTTIQALQAIYRDDSNSFKELKNLIDVVIFDEGHREPAFTWAETIRSLEKPTILFSATPYRNDYRFFNIDKSNYYYLQHLICVSKNYLRDIVIKEVKSKDLNGFVKEMLTGWSTLQKTLITSGIKEPKVIVRCDSDNTVRLMTLELIKNGCNAIGIHENFTNRNNLFSEVPNDTVQKNFTFFVHQYKLIEGIDNPDFCVLILYEPLGNSRSFVQQIGRIIRNVNLSKNQRAYVLTGDDLIAKDQWNKYLLYDSELGKRNTLFDLTDIVKIDTTIKQIYFDRKFREVLNIENSIDLNELQLPLRINIFRNINKIDFDELYEILLNDWEKKDHNIITTFKPESNSFIVVYITYKNSALLKDGLFIEQKLVVTYAELRNDRFYFFDSESGFPEELFQSLQTIPLAILQKLFNEKKRITRLGLRNGNLDQTSLRSREISAINLGNTSPDLNDHLFFATTFEGYLDSKFVGMEQRRYVGIRHAKVSDFGSKRYSLKEFSRWLDYIDANLNQTENKFKDDSLVNRFAELIDTPPYTDPINILIDVDLEELASTIGMNMAISETCADITGSKFVLNIDSEDYTVKIAFDKKINKYLLDCEEISSKYYSPTNKIDFIKYLNNNQAFRVITKNNSAIYSSNNFFKPSINLRKNSIEHLFRKFDPISKMTSEKGDAGKPIHKDQWHKETLFGLICRQGKGYLTPGLAKEFGFDHMVCDDLQNPEIADFIAIDSKSNRVVLIHAKAGDSTLSASAFAVVCAQATKNLDYLSPFFERQPEENIKKWNNSWSLANIGIVKKRILYGGLTAMQFYNLFRSIIADPRSKKEVWVMVGNTFDLKSFIKQVVKSPDKMKPQVLQLYYLIKSTWSSVSSLGAEFKIFC